MTQPQHDIAAQLKAMLAAAGLPALRPATVDQFETYFSILHRWNERINLTAIRTEAEILSRHFVESIAVAHSLPSGIATLLDFGSGAGFPGLPIALCRPQIAVVLAESQVKKAAFLREAVRTLNLPVEVFTGRAETMIRTFDCVVLRAVDRMDQAVKAAASMVSSSGCLALLVTQPMAAQFEAAAGPGFNWQSPVPLPGAESRVLILATRS